MSLELVPLTQLFAQPLTLAYKDKKINRKPTLQSAAAVRVTQNLAEQYKKGGWPYLR